MVARSSLIEINGHLYDTRSGELATGQIAGPLRSSTITHPVIDGFVRNQRSSSSAEPKQTQPTEEIVSGSSCALSAAKLHRKPLRTLRILGAKPPVTISNNDIAFGDIDKSAVTKRRARRAEYAVKHSLISRFSQTIFAAGNSAPTDTSPPAQEMPVESTKSLSGKKAAVPRRWVRPSSLLKRPQKQLEPPIVSVSEPSPKPSWFKRYLLPASVSLAALVIIAGLLIYHNIPGLSMRLAASRAGFDASVPAYHPSGFSFEGPVAYSPGKITIRFASNTDDRQYLITQKESSWDSQTLLDNVVSKESGQPLSIQEHGVTIYLYQGHLATWVNGGVWYTIDNSANLSSEQLLKIAASL